MPNIPFTRRRRGKTRFPPPGLFVLVTPEDKPLPDVSVDEDIDGPYDGSEGEWHMEGDLFVFHTEGFPGLLKVEDVGDGRIVTFEGGVKARVEPWPLPEFDHAE